MKYLKRFNEAIIDYKSDNITNFYDEVKNLFTNSNFVTFSDVVKIGSEFDIEVVNYDTFYEELPESDKSTAPPKGPIFALVNPVTNKSRVVISSGIYIQDLEHIYHMLKHENIHIGQVSKRPGYNKPIPDPKNQKEYFSDYDEVMAFSHSVVDMLMRDNPRSIKDGMSKLNRIGLYSHIKRIVDKDTLKKYHKYIYQYLEKELSEVKK